MQGETNERWKVLCEQASKEQDPQELTELVNQINRLLDEKASRLNKQKTLLAIGL